MTKKKTVTKPLITKVLRDAGMTRFEAGKAHGFMIIVARPDDTLDGTQYFVKYSGPISSPE